MTFKGLRVASTGLVCAVCGEGPVWRGRGAYYLGYRCVREGRGCGGWLCTKRCYWRHAC
jgi:hypothetical protein